MLCGPCRDLGGHRLTETIPDVFMNNVHLASMSVISSVAAADAVGDTCVLLLV